jgi:hypothetical protein
MDDEMRTRLLDYFARHGVANPRLVMLTIGRRAYPGVGYTVGDNARIYCLGERPNLFARRKTAVVLDGDEHEWYLAAYMLEAHITPKNAAYHPFGANFLLSQWRHAYKIDKFNYWRGEYKPYARVIATTMDI